MHVHIHPLLTALLGYDCFIRVLVLEVFLAFIVKVEGVKLLLCNLLLELAILSW